VAVWSLLRRLAGGTTGGVFAGWRHVLVPKAVYLHEVPIVNAGHTLEMWHHYASFISLSQATSRAIMHCFHSSHNTIGGHRHFQRFKMVQKIWGLGFPMGLGIYGFLAFALLLWPFWYPCVTECRSWTPEHLEVLQKKHDRDIVQSNRSPTEKSKNSMPSEEFETWRSGSCY